MEGIKIAHLQKSLYDYKMKGEWIPEARTEYD